MATVRVAKIRAACACRHCGHRDQALAVWQRRDAASIVVHYQHGKKCAPLSRRLERNAGRHGEGCLYLWRVDRCDTFLAALAAGGMGFPESAAKPST